MKKFRMAEFVTKPKIVDEAGKYETRNGEFVTVNKVFEGGTFAAIGEYDKCGTAEAWDISGRLLPYSETDNDIVKKVLD